MELKIIGCRSTKNKKYIRFGHCSNCGCAVVLEGSHYELSDYERWHGFCPKCTYMAIECGLMHKADGIYAKHKLKKLNRDMV